ncbi:MAG: hypothetical protein WC346_02820 [Methanogenium sp.]|jgi:hypothetical protein
MCQLCVKLGIATPENKKGSVAAYTKEKAAKKDAKTKNAPQGKPQGKPQGVKTGKVKK